MENERFIATPGRTQAILEKYQLDAKKSLGQNFLIDATILKKIVQTAEIDPTIDVIEVGPGLGGLTEQLALAAKRVLSLEIDQRLLPVLKETLRSYDNVTVLQQDILAADLATLMTTYLPDSKSLAVVANLPYYITTPIMLSFFRSSISVDTMALLMQKEVVERIIAEPGSKAYGSLSILVQYYMQPSLAFLVPPTVFIPQPNVESAVLKLTRREQPAVEVTDEAFFLQVVRASFAQRRKTLWNNLINHFGKSPAVKHQLNEALAEIELDPQRRAETLSLSEFAALANELSRFFCSRN